MQDDPGGATDERSGTADALVHDRAKDPGLVRGVAVSILLIHQQVGVYIGMRSRAAAAVRDVPEPTIWVMDPGLRNMDSVFPMRDTWLGWILEGAGVR